jgi:pimeloyl-ACP methyl ester carboxylesterase
VLLLHGFPQRATSWAKVAELLNERGLRTLAPDQRGYSPQARPRLRTAYALPHLVADVAELVSLTGGRVHLVGHDWGAVVAWALAAERPELVQSLVTVSVPHPRAFARSLLSSAQAYRSLYVAPFQVPLLPELAATSAPWLVEAALRRSGMPHDALVRFRREILDDGALGTALGWYRAIPLGGRSPAMRRSVRVPTTHVWSDRDGALSRRGAELCGEHVRAPYRLEIMEGISHWIPDQAPQRLATSIEQRISSSGPRR